jgi:methionyl-tRNA synthetase
MAPWKISLDSEEDKEKLRNILFILISNLRKVAIMLLPFFDSKMRELLSRVGVPYDDTLTIIDNLELDPTLFTIGEK